MKRMNSKGFTLIELLAVITIMGILMMVAIPSVSRTIENSRRDTFASTAKQYITTIRDNVLAGNIDCGTAKGLPASMTDYEDYGAKGLGDYWYTIDSQDTVTTDLMEAGGKSSFGNNDVIGYVRWHVENQKAGDGSNNTIEATRTTYYIQLCDTAGHGIKADTEENAVKRSEVVTSGCDAHTKGTTGSVPAGKVSKTYFATDSDTLPSDPVDYSNMYHCRLK